MKRCIIRRIIPSNTAPCRRAWQLSRTPKPTSDEFQSLLSLYAKKPPRPVPLSRLLSFANPLTKESVLASASYALSEMPRRLYQRVRAFDEKIPFIVGTNPFIARTHELARSTFQTLASFPPIITMEDNEAFSRTLENLVEKHSNDIPTLAKGFQESSRYMAPEAVSTFLDESITHRISDRLIAEQHIAVSRALQHPLETFKPLGVLNFKCSPMEMIRMCSIFVHDLCEATYGIAPTIQVEGAVDARFPYVPVHIEYILTEVLKNAFRATVEQYAAIRGSKTITPSSASELPPVTITISPSDKFLSLRVRDEGGGVPPVNVENVFSYAFTTAGRNRTDFEDEGMGGGPYAAQHVGGSAALGLGIGAGGAGDGNLFGEIIGRGLQTGLGTIAGLGYGLPMARLYAQYFGGNLELVSLHGHGTDVFIKLKRLDPDANVMI